MSAAAVIVVVLHYSLQSWLNHLKSHFKQEQDNQPDICQIRFGYRLEIKNGFKCFIKKQKQSHQVPKTDEKQSLYEKKV